MLRAAVPRQGGGYVRAGGGRDLPVEDGRPGISGRDVWQQHMLLLAGERDDGKGLAGAEMALGQRVDPARIAPRALARGGGEIQEDHDAQDSPQR